MEALRFLRHAGFSTIKADGGGGIGGRLGIGDLAGKHDAALNSFRKDGLARLGMLVPAESLAGQKRIAEPLESDEGMTAAFGFGQCGAELFYAGIEVGGDLRFLAVIFVVFVVILDDRPRGARCAGRTFGVADPLEVDADLVFLRGPNLRRCVAALAAAVFTA